MEEKKLAISSCAISSAGWSKNWDLVKWLFEKGAYIGDGNPYACNGNLEMLKWWRSNGGKWSESLVRDALVRSECNLELIQWLYEEGCPFTDEDFRTAFSMAEDEEALTWLRSVTTVWDETLCEKAAKGGTYCLKWLRENGCPWDERTCYQAAKHSALTNLKWARENGCPWTHEVCKIAVKNGDLRIFKWAIENGCKCGPEVSLEAVRKGHTNILQYLKDTEGPWHSDTLVHAKKLKDMKVLFWARKEGILTPQNEVMRIE